MQSRNVITRVGWLGLILFIAVAARLASALLQGNVIETLPGIHDQISYDLLARRVLDGFGFTVPAGHWPATKADEPTAHWSYLYTLYLSSAYGIFSAHPLAARLIQAVIVGLLQPWLTWRLARRVFGRPAALLAALISAVYVYFVYYGGALMTEAFFIVAVLWSLDLSTSMAAAEDNISKRDWMLLGLAVGFAVLLRQVFLLFVPFLLGWLIWHARPQGLKAFSRFRRPIAGALLTVVTLACLVLPWTVRNYLAFGRFALLNSNAGFAFFWGNHPIHQREFIPILSGTGPSYRELIPREIVELNEVALDQELLRRGLQFVREDPIRYLQLSASRAKEYFKFWPSPESSQLSNLARVGSFGVLLPFMLVGLAVGASSRLDVGHPREEEEEKNQESAGLLYLFILVFTLVHLLSWSLIRYRLPVDAVLVIFASNGLLYVVRRLDIFSEHQLQPAP